MHEEWGDVGAPFDRHVVPEIALLHVRHVAHADAMPLAQQRARDVSAHPGGAPCDEEAPRRVVVRARHAAVRGGEQPPERFCQGGERKQHCHEHGIGHGGGEHGGDEMVAGRR